MGWRLLACKCCGLEFTSNHGNHTTFCSNRCGRYFQLKLWRKRHPDREAKQKRRYKLKHKYGITEEVYNRMFEQQNGKCKVCMRQELLKIDHNHKTGEIRGLLCDRCNLAIGLFRDDPGLCLRASGYLGGVV